MTGFLAQVPAGVMLLAALALLAARRQADQMRLYQIQSAALAVAAAAQGLFGGLFVVTLLAAGVGVGALPWAMRRWPEAGLSKSLPPAILLSLAGLLAGVAMLVAPAGLAMPLALLLLGLLALAAGVPPVLAIGIAANGVALAACAALALAVQPGMAADGLAPSDPLGLMFGGLSVLVTLIGVLRGTSRADVGRRLLLLACVLLGLSTDDMAVLWLAAGAAAVILAWPDARLAGGALLLAAFGTLLVSMAGAPASLWSFAASGRMAPQLNGDMLVLGFVLVVAGYGILAMLAARREVLGIVPLNLALVAILRFRHIAQGHFAAGGAVSPAGILLVSGLLALFAAGLGRGAARNAGTAHAGLALVAFGVGGPAALFGGLLNMMLFTLAGCAWTAATRRGPAWLTGACMFALAGLPPSGLFSSEFIIVSQTVLRAPWLAPLLGLALALFGARILRRARHPAGLAVHGDAGRLVWLPALPLALMLLLGFAMPGAFARVLSGIAVALQ